MRPEHPQHKVGQVYNFVASSQRQLRAPVAVRQESQQNPSLGLGLPSRDQAHSCSCENPCALFPSFCALLDRGRNKDGESRGEGPAYLSFIRCEETEDNHEPQDCTKSVFDNFSGIRL
jgi:hypothetical protein